MCRYFFMEMDGWCAAVDGRGPARCVACVRSALPVSCDAGANLRSPHALSDRVAVSNYVDPPLWR